MQVRSPSALVASLLCLLAAGGLAWIGADEAPSLAPGDHVTVTGELMDYEPDPSWTELAEVLHGTTYALDLDGVDDLVLITGLEPGWEDHTIVADAIVIHEMDHPEAAVDIIVLAVENPDDVEHELLG